jgi:hypothetical protein
LEPGEAKTMEANGKAKRSDLGGTELATENDSEWRVANGEWFFFLKGSAIAPPRNFGV